MAAGLMAEDKRVAVARAAEVTRAVLMAASGG